MAYEMSIGYSDYVAAADKLGYFDNTEEAESAVKMVLGILASRLEEREAHKLTDRLPSPLTYQRLRSHQAHVTPISAEQYLTDLEREFGMSRDQALTLVGAVLAVTRNALGDEAVDELAESLPPDWNQLLMEA
jgi:uncharacterized protein (DUF2267 family)